VFNPEPNATVTLSPLLSFEFLSSARTAGAVEPRPAATRRPKPIHRSVDMFIVSLPFLAALLHRQMVPTSAGCALSGDAIPSDSDALKPGLFPVKGHEDRFPPLSLRDRCEVVEGTSPHVRRSERKPEWLLRVDTPCAGWRSSAQPHCKISLPVRWNPWVAVAVSVDLTIFPASRENTGNFAYFALLEAVKWCRISEDNNVLRGNSRRPRTGKFRVSLGN